MKSGETPDFTKEMDKNNLVVVGKSPSKYIEYVNGYRGTSREGINYPVEYWDVVCHIRDVFIEYDELTETEAFIRDIDFARELRDVYNQVYPDGQREILEITFDNKASQLNGTFLGFDIVNCEKSNILWILALFNCEIVHGSEFGKTLKLISPNVVKLLNESYLFNNYEDAKMVLKLIEGICEIFRQLSPRRTYEVIGVYLVE